jgi:hypothetical protein
MRNNWPLRAAIFLFVIFLVAVLSWLTQPPLEDPCANPQVDVSAAVLADQPGDQDALVNRAIILKGNCEKESTD